MTSERPAVGYVRLSQQFDRSLATQRTDIRDYCTRSELSLVEIYNEGEGVSGYDNDREEYTRMLSYVQEHEIDAVVVRDLARLSRDRKERLRFLLDLDTAGVELHSVERGKAIDLDEDWAYVLQAIQATTDDVQKRKEIERSKRKTARRVEAGYHQGRSPFGTCFDAAGEHLVPDPDEWPTIMDAFGMNDQWILRVLYPPREDVSVTIEFASDSGLTFDIESIRELEGQPAGRYGLSEAQYEALAAAVTHGYYHVPRENNLEEIAPTLGISHQALSERIRRATQALIKDTILIGPQSEDVSTADESHEQ